MYVCMHPCMHIKQVGVSPSKKVLYKLDYCKSIAIAMNNNVIRIRIPCYDRLYTSVP